MPVKRTENEAGDSDLDDWLLAEQQLRDSDG